MNRDLRQLYIDMLVNRKHVDIIKKTDEVYKTRYNTQISEQLPRLIIEIGIGNYGYLGHEHDIAEYIEYENEMAGMKR